MALLMLRWWRTLPTFRDSRSSWGAARSQTRLIARNKTGSEVAAAHHGHVVQHAPVDASLVKVTLVLGEADVVQPP